jgi:hypothetical protein
LLDLMRFRCKYQIIFGGNYFNLPPAEQYPAADRWKTLLDYIVVRITSHAEQATAA